MQSMDPAQLLAVIQQMPQQIQQLMQQQQVAHLTAGSERQSRQLDPKGFDNIETLSGGEEQWQNCSWRGGPLIGDLNITEDCRLCVTADILRWWLCSPCSCSGGVWPYQSVHEHARGGSMRPVLLRGQVAPRGYSGGVHESAHLFAPFSSPQVNTAEDMRRMWLSTRLRCGVTSTFSKILTCTLLLSPLLSELRVNQCES